MEYSLREPMKFALICRRSGKWKTPKKFADAFSHLHDDTIADVFANMLRTHLERTAHGGVGRLSLFQVAAGVFRSEPDGKIDHVAFVVYEHRVQPLLRAFFAPLLLVQYGIFPWEFFLASNRILSTAHTAAESTKKRLGLHEKPHDACDESACEKGDKH